MSNEAVSALSDFEVESITRALADPRRFQILREIAGQQQVACAQLLEHHAITAPTLSHHLKELEAARLITASRRGKFVELEFRRDVWAAFLTELEKLSAG